MRLGPGPVFVYEWVAAARRRRLYAARSVFVAFMLAGMAIAYRSLPRNTWDDRFSLATLAYFGQNLYKTVAWIELTLILMLAPAATAGAVCLDNARGTLDHMLATDLSNAEIILGKLGVRLIPILGLILATLPVMALSTLLGGIDPAALLGLFQVAVGCALVGCSLAMVLSIYGRKTHEVVMMAYVIILFWLMAPLFLELAIDAVYPRFVPPAAPGMPPPPPPPGPPLWLSMIHDGSSDAHPYMLAFATYDDPTPPDETRYLGFLAGCLGVSALLVGLATARVRRVALKATGRGVKSRRRSGWPRNPFRLPGPSLDRNPIAWREWHRTRPSWMARIVWGLYAALGGLWFVLVLRMWDDRNEAAFVAGLMIAVQVTIGLLLVAVAAATSLSEERARGSLDLLLSTPMSTPEILAGKWWAGFRRAPSVAFWPAMTGAVAAFNGGSWLAWLLLILLVLAHCAVITSLGLLLATWIRRVGVAIAACVAIYVAFLIGWPIFIAYSARGPGSAVLAMLGADPPAGVAFATFAIADGGPLQREPGFGRDGLFVSTIIWIVMSGMAAAVLFSFAVGSFDACMGRIPDDGPPPTGPDEASPTVDELLERVPRSSGDDP